MTVSSRWISQDDVYTPMSMGVIISARYHKHMNVSRGITATTYINSIATTDTWTCRVVSRQLRTSTVSLPQAHERVVWYHGNYVHQQYRYHRHVNVSRGITATTYINSIATTGTWTCRVASRQLRTSTVSLPQARERVAWRHGNYVHQQYRYHRHMNVSRGITATTYINSIATTGTWTCRVVSRQLRTSTVSLPQALERVAWYHGNYVHQQYRYHRHMNVPRGITATTYINSIATTGTWTCRVVSRQLRTSTVSLPQAHERAAWYHGNYVHQQYRYHRHMNVSCGITATTYINSIATTGTWTCRVVSRQLRTSTVSLPQAHERVAWRHGNYVHQQYRYHRHMNVSCGITATTYINSIATTGTWTCRVVSRQLRTSTVSLPQAHERVAWHHGNYVHQQYRYHRHVNVSRGITATTYINSIATTGTWTCRVVSRQLRTSTVSLPQARERVAWYHGNYVHQQYRYHRHMYVSRGITATMYINSIATTGTWTCRVVSRQLRTSTVSLPQAHERVAWYHGNYVHQQYRYHRHMNVSRGITATTYINSIATTGTWTCRVVSRQLRTSTVSLPQAHERVALYHGNYVHQQYRYHRHVNVSRGITATTYINSIATTGTCTCRVVSRQLCTSTVSLPQAHERVAWYHGNYVHQQYRYHRHMNVSCGITATTYINSIATTGTWTCRVVSRQLRTSTVSLPQAHERVAWHHGNYVHQQYRYHRHVNVSRGITATTYINSIATTGTWTCRVVSRQLRTSTVSLPQARERVAWYHGNYVHQQYRYHRHMYVSRGITATMYINSIATTGTWTCRVVSRQLRTSTVSLPQAHERVVWYHGNYVHQQYRYHRHMNVPRGITATTYINSIATTGTWTCRVASRQLRTSTVSLHGSANVKRMTSIVYVAFCLQHTLNMNWIVRHMQ